MNYAGFYINLDRRVDRRAEIEAELARCGLTDAYMRFSATDGNALGFPNPHIKSGEMGCFASHYMLLKQNLDETRPLHIIEDDVIFSSASAQAINGVIDRGLFGDCDIVYTDVLIPLLNDAYKAYKEFYDATVTRDKNGNIAKVAFSVVDLKGLLFGSTSSYMVNKNSIRKLHELYRHEISNEPRTSNDLFIRRLCHEGALKVGCLFPFATSVRLDHIVETDINRDYHQMSALAVHLARYSFFVGADMRKCQEYLDKFMPLPPQTDRHAQILSHLLAFSLTGNYRSF